VDLRGKSFACRAEWLGRCTLPAELATMPPTVLPDRAVLCRSGHGAAGFPSSIDVLRHTRRAAAATLLVGCLLAVAAPAAAGGDDPRPDERGLPTVTVVPPADIGASQLFSASVARHRLHVGTLHGLALFDGAQWELVDSPRALYAVHAGAGGRVIAGGPDLLVELRTAVDGHHALVSLIERLPAADRAIGDVRTVVELDGIVFAVTDRLLLRVAGTDVRVVDRWRSDPARRLFVSAGRIYVVSQGAVRAFDPSGQRAEDAITSREHRGGVTVIVDHPAAGQIVALDGQGLFAVRDGTWRPVAPDAAPLRRHLTDARTLDDGSVAVASASDGVLRLSPDLTFDGALSRAEGLPSSHVEALAVDEDGGLWAVAPSSLARIDFGTALTRIDERLGLEGTVNRVVRHRGRLHVLTSSGLYVVDRRPGHPLRATLVPGVPARAWSALAAGERLLVATASGVFDVGPDGSHLVPGTRRVSAYVLDSVAGDPARVLVGSRTGLGVLVRDGGGWRLERSLPDAPRYVRSIVSRPGGIVFVGSTFDGVVRLSLAGEPPVTVCGGETTIRDVDGVIHVLSTDVPSLTVLDEASGTLKALRRGRVVVPPGSVRFAFHPGGALWVSGRGAVVDEPGRGSRPLLDPSVSIQALDIDADGVVWLGGPSGLWRFADRATRPAPLRAPTLSRVHVNGRLVPTSGPDGGPVDLPFGIERLHVTFSPNTFAAAALTDFKLEPFDGEWMPARGAQAPEYTSLPEGVYRLRLRSTQGSQQAESTWTFRVLPPWYRSPWMYLGWVVAGVALLMALGHLHTRRLQRRARDLERAVVEQTAALQQANRRLAELASRDELTGLYNRRRFEETLATEWARARRDGSPVALVLVDIDLFKTLNDSLGHMAGDRALKAVASVIERAARRPADAAARYGGDEFAVLLPGGRAERASELAEEIRTAVEALALPHPGHPLGHVTVSVGVAAAAAGDGEPTLVDDADRALYRAKAGGRNAVAA
jgi:diguanylate cyclase (GGDEF)-like protein